MPSLEKLQASKVLQKLKATLFIDLSDINHQFPKNSCGTPKNTIPPKPKKEVQPSYWIN